MSDLLSYYRARANEYESVYVKPERQRDLGLLHQLVPEWFADRHVLEVACGTGYWTRRIALTAATVTACDLARETLDIAHAQNRATESVRFVEADAFALENISGTFDAAFVGFFWSHIPRSNLRAFLDGLHRRLSGVSRVLILDNRYVIGSSSLITRTDALGNTYQDRVLTNGVHHEVLKNFPSVSELQEAMTAAGAMNLSVHLLPYFWYATYDVAGAT